MSPFIDHVRNLFGFVDPTVIHHYNGPGAGEFIHLVQEAMDKPFEKLRVVRALDYIQSDDPVKGQCWED